MPLPQEQAALPHDSWAAHYDRVYALTFGAHYQHMTDSTLAEIARVAPPPGRLVDFGAGTGRLALPLAAQGYEVTAVEPCAGMLQCLAAKPGSARVSPVRCLLQDFQAAAPFDLALCVFTVIAYLTDEDALRAGFRAMAAALKPGGRLLLDTPKRVAFNGMHVEREGMVREVTVRPLDGDLYRYEERTRLEGPEGVRVYEDAFVIRYWEPETVKRVAGECGLTVAEDVSAAFAGTGAGYWWLEKGAAA